jgi:methylthioribose-1-phosphate isomerase
LQTDFHKQCGKPVGLARGIIKSEAKHMRSQDWWSAMDAPAAKPSKVDYARAAMGLEVPEIELAAKQSRAYEVQKNSMAKMRKTAFKVSKKASDLEADASHLSERERLFEARVKRVEDIEKENRELRRQLAELAPKPAQDFVLRDLGLS